MALSEGDKAIMEAMAYKVGDVMLERFKKEIELHGEKCQAAKTVSQWRGQAKALVIGVAIGAAVITTGGFVGILKLFKVL